MTGKIRSVDPRTGASLEVTVEPTSTEALDECCRDADEARGALEGLGRTGRAALLRSMADALESLRAPLVAMADRETALGTGRLNGELTRTVFQLGFFAEVLEDGSYLEVVIDHAGPTPMGARPDLRRMLRPVGAVGVFGASNFPFAFSVPGGDTASALAAGCPVVVKAHDAHLGTSLHVRDALRQGATKAGAPPAVVSLVFGEGAGRALVQHPMIRAVGFTGSLAGGTALARLAAGRPSPIPFYGELGAVNAVLVLPGAAHRRPEEIGVGLAESFSLGVGQFCTKPGVAFVPAGPDGDVLISALGEAVRALTPSPMLSGRIAEAFARGAAARRMLAGVRLVADAASVGDGPFAGHPVVLEAGEEDFGGELLEECFGPLLVVVRYGGVESLERLVDRLLPGLTMSVHGEAEDVPLAGELLDATKDVAGRYLWNGYPTGVAVSWAMQHGGPFPATTDPLQTSVGAMAIRRWLRPVTFQGFPPALLAEELKDDPMPGARLPRRVDGKLSL